CGHADDHDDQRGPPHSAPGPGPGAPGPRPASRAVTAMTIHDLLTDRRPAVFDGAMGTMLYSRGVYINRCYDELSLREPDMIREVHREYLRAGAESLERNSMGGNRMKLAEYGRDTQVAAISSWAGRIAKEVAGPNALGAGAIGPLGSRIEPYGPTSLDEARALFREQAAALLEGGAD